MTKKEKYLMYIVLSIITLVFNGAFRIFDAAATKVEQSASVVYVDSENKDQDALNYKAHDDIVIYVDKMDKIIDSKIDNTQKLFLDEIRLLRQDLKLKVDKE